MPSTPVIVMGAINVRPNVRTHGLPCVNNLQRQDSETLRTSLETVVDTERS
jgi:hypothetical protein